MKLMIFFGATVKIYYLKNKIHEKHPNHFAGDIPQQLKLELNQTYNILLNNQLEPADTNIQ